MPCRLRRQNTWRIRPVCGTFRPMTHASRTRADLIRDKLTAALHPTLVEVEDDSARHAGHMGHPGHGPDGKRGGESHFNVRVVAPAFAGKSRIDRQRMVYFILDAELKNGVHALALDCKAPGE